MVGKGSGIVRKRAGRSVFGEGFGELLFVFGNERFVETVKGINVDHHSGGAVDNSKVIAE